MVRFLIGIDGGGSGTRALLADLQGRPLGRGGAGPSGLALGIGPAWQAIAAAVEDAQRAAGITAAIPECALGIGLAGLNHPGWRAEFLAAAPPWARIVTETDGGIALRAAHQGRPGVLVAAGTGSVGEALLTDGSRRSVGGWGFPVGDEGSGAWLGLAAVRQAQWALDGRADAGALARAVWQACGGTVGELIAWGMQAGQSAYAALAPLVFACAGQDQYADQLLDAAAVALEQMALALDPAASLPVSLQGSVGIRLFERCSPALRARARAGEVDATCGALLLLQGSL